LLKFAEKKELQKNGWKWLLIHCCNLYGKQKESNINRKNWSIKNLANIRKSAVDPIRNVWWQRGDKPWQILACCFEIDDAIKSGLN